jgi:hypothetical protein
MLQFPLLQIKRRCPNFLAAAYLYAIQDLTKQLDAAQNCCKRWRSRGSNSTAVVARTSSPVVHSSANNVEMAVAGVAG